MKFNAPKIDISLLSVLSVAFVLFVLGLCGIATTTITTCNAAPMNADIEDDIICPAEQDESAFVKQYPSAMDCSVFYKCNRGVPNKIKCPDGLHYNARIEACDFPARANCHLIAMV